MARRQDMESISTWLKGLGSHKQLTREEEYSLAKLARKGDADARNLLATSNLPFVVGPA